jgi:excisionase family DNA binding protein
MARSRIENRITTPVVYLTKAEAAEYCGVTVRSISRWVAEGKIKAHRGVGRPRFRRDEIDAAIEAIR